MGNIRHFEFEGTIYRDQEENKTYIALYTYSVIDIHKLLREELLPGSHVKLILTISEEEWE